MTARSGLAADQLLRAATARLAGAGVITARADAELLLARALDDPATGDPATGDGATGDGATGDGATGDGATGGDRPATRGGGRHSRADAVRLGLLGTDVAPAAVARFDALVERRAAREPLQHLTGRAGFRLIELEVGPGVFVPRPETEIVAGLAVEEARRLADGGEAPLVVDLCSGSGAIAFSVAAEVPAARVVGVELDEAAVRWSRANLLRLGLSSRVELRCADVRRADRLALAELAGEVDVVVSNPPYIPPDAEPVDPEVRDHDPVLALYGGGDDGLEVPAAVVAAASGLLRPGGLLVMEHAESQAGSARALATRPVWEGTHTVPDLTGRPRALVARRGMAHSQP